MQLARGVEDIGRKGEKDRGEFINTAFAGKEKGFANSAATEICYASGSFASMRRWQPQSASTSFMASATKNRAASRS